MYIHMCMYICVHMCTYVYICVHIYTYTYTHIYGVRAAVVCAPLISIHKYKRRERHAIRTSYTQARCANATQSTVHDARKQVQ